MDRKDIIEKYVNLPGINDLVKNYDYVSDDLLLKMNRTKTIKTHLNLPGVNSLVDRYDYFFYNLLSDVRSENSVSAELFGDKLMISTTAGKVKIYNLITREVEYNFKPFMEMVSDIYNLKDGRFIFANTTMSLWDYNTMTKIIENDTASGNNIKMLPNGNIIFSNKDGIYIWDLKTNEISDVTPMQLRNDDDYFYNCPFEVIDNEHILLTQEEKDDSDRVSVNIILYDIKRKEIIKLTKYIDFIVMPFIYKISENEILINGFSRKKGKVIFFFDIQTWSGERKSEFEIKGNVKCINFTPDGELIYGTHYHITLYRGKDFIQKLNCEIIFVGSYGKKSVVVTRRNIYELV